MAILQIPLSCELGVPLVTGDIPGVAVILGSAPTAQGRC